MVKAAGSAGTPKNKKASAKQKNNNRPELSDLDETPFNQRKGPPEDIMPSLVPYTRRNALCTTRNALPQPPSHVYIPPVDGKNPLESTIEDKDCNPLDHTSPQNHPPASFVEAEARAASPADAPEDNDEEEGVNLEDMFKDLVGDERSGLDDLTYSSDKDDDDYDDNMDEEARQIEYSDVMNVRHGQRQTYFIPGGPKPPTYNGMSAAEKVLAKKEYTKERKKYTDGLRIKRLKDQNKEYEPESFSGCLALVLRPMSDVQKCRLEVNHTFPDKEILAMRVAEKANL